MVKNFSLLGLIILFTFCSCNRSERSLFRIMEDGLYGFVDSTGSVVITPQYKYVSRFNPNRSLEKVSCLFLMTAIRKIALYMLDL